jgi:O-antigen/teichoic acid export membrane protein
MKTLTPILYYGFALVFIKAMAIFTIPLVTNAITPSEFGKLELIVSLVECAALISGLAIAEVFNRVADNREKRRELAGAALIITGVSLVLFQLLAITHPSLLIHTALVTASLTAMIELPLANLRIENRARFFAILLVSRSLASITLQYIFLKNGYGIEGILLANMLVELTISLFLATHFHKNYGFAFSKSAFSMIARVSLPYVLGALAMFMVGNADRWFLMRYVTLEDIAFYGIAVKFSLFVALFSHAFSMWWGPRKYATYFGENGMEKTRNILLIGFAFNMLGGLIVAFSAPLFIILVLPATYLDATQYIPLLIVVSLLNETATLVSLGAYRAKTGLPVLLINSAGAIMAITGYMILIPVYGVKGAIYATILAHFLRVCLYAYECQRVTPLFGKRVRHAHA